MSWRKIAYLDEVATLSNNAPQDVIVQTPSAGVGAAATRDDHKHNLGAHKTSHQDGGSDEISVAGLSGTLADPQTPAAHALSGHTQAIAELLINKQALRNPVIDPQASAPSSPVDGQVYYSSVDDHLYCFVA